MYVAVDRGGPQHVEIVHFAEQVLQSFQIVTPLGMLSRQKVFHRITKVFDSDTQFVPADRGPGADSAFVQLVSLRPLFERKMKVNEASRAHPCRAARQRLAPLPPLFAIELFEILASTR